MYTVNMVFATAEKALRPKFEHAKIVSWVLAGLLTIMAIAQLYAFETFIPLLDTLYLGSANHALATVIAAILVFTEVFSLPFLLRMELSPLMRWFSLSCTLFVPLFWLGLSAAMYWTTISPTIFAVTGGMFGEKLPLASAYQIVFELVLAATAIYCVYGLWPKRRK